MRSRARLSTHPIHPMLVTLPIGLWLTSWVFDVLGRWTGSPSLQLTGYYLVIAGCIGAVLAALPGAIDYFGVVPPNSSAKRRGAIHGLLNTAVLVAFLFVVYLRRGPDHGPSNLTLAISTVLILVLGYSGWLGGTLSYLNQIGVYRHYAQAKGLVERTITNIDQPLCNQSELADGQMLLVHDQRGSRHRRIVVGKSTHGLFAFADHCSHKGGPLCDGALVDNAVQCPWHGSQFDVRTGRVVSGPAEQSIETYPLREREGEVYLDQTGSDNIRRVA